MRPAWGPYASALTPGAIRSRRPTYGRPSAGRPADGAERDGGASDDAVDVFRVAAVWRRPIRWFVDGLALLVVYTATVSALEQPVGERPAVMIAWTVASLVVLIGPTAEWGRTVGGLLTSTIVLADDDLGVPGWGRSVVRWIVPQVPGLAAFGLVELGAGTWVVGVWFIGLVVIYGWILIDRDNRCVHDLWSRTMVFDRRRR